MTQVISKHFEEEKRELGRDSAHLVRWRPPGSGLTPQVDGGGDEIQPEVFESNLKETGVRK